MIALLYLLYTRLFAAARAQTPGRQQIFNILAMLTIVLWSLSPIVWLLGTEGFGAFGLAWGIIFLLVLGLLAMVGFLLLTNRQALGEISGGTAQPSRVR